MYLPGHLGLGLLACAAIVALGPRRRPAVAACAPVVLASAPDIDLYLAGIPHRGITHTVWAVVGLGLGLAAVAGLWTRRRGTERIADVTLAFAAGVVAGSMHLIGDVVTPMGIRPLHPLLATSYSLDLVASRNPTANLVLLCAGCAAVGLVAVRERARWAPSIRARLPRWRRPDGDGVA